jgi:hypothetical protein
MVVVGPTAVICASLRTLLESNGASRYDARPCFPVEQSSATNGDVYDSVVEAFDTAWLGTAP